MPALHLPGLARSLSNLGMCLSQLGRPADALPAEQEATAIRRELATVNPGGHRSELAASLSNLGLRFAELGRPAEGLPAEQEAVSIYRELATVSPGRLLGLVRSLSNLGLLLAQANREPADRKAALAACREAIGVYRQLVTADLGSIRPELARSLPNIAFALTTLGMAAEAAEVHEEIARAETAVRDLLWSVAARFVAVRQTRALS